MMKTRKQTIGCWLCLFGLLTPFEMVHADEQEGLPISPDASEILYSGRRSVEEGGRVHLSYSGARVRLAFRGDTVVAHVHATNRENFVNVYINGERTQKLLLPMKKSVVVLAEGLDSQETHTVELVKATEGFAGEWVFSGFDLPNKGQAVPWPEPETRRILFIGDSITCGYGIEADGPDNPFRNQDQNFCLTYAGLTARALNADYEVVARSGIGFYRNYNGPREGSTGNMPALFDRVHFRQKNPVWNHLQFTPDLILINLGTNDFSTDGPDVDLLIQSGTEFLNRLHTLYPDSRLLLLAGPLQKSKEYHSALQSMLDQSVYNKTGALFIQSPQGNLGFGTHWHPSIRQAQKNADELIVHLREWMGW